MDVVWAVFVGVNLLGMREMGAWSTIPFLVIWVSLTLIYGEQQMFLVDASHELSTPITVALGHAELPVGPAAVNGNARASATPSANFT
ncbi:MAG: hypothetical protein ACRDPY_09415 [Streptosporangiaceae bacterium]